MAESEQKPVAASLGSARAVQNYGRIVLPNAEIAPLLTAYPQYYAFEHLVPSLVPVFGHGFATGDCMLLKRLAPGNPTGGLHCSVLPVERPFEHVA